MNSTVTNLTIEGIKSFFLLVEKIFNGKDYQNYEIPYKNHIEIYKKYKANVFKTDKITKIIHPGCIPPIKLVVSRNHLTSAIHYIAEIISGREFSCDFNKYTIDDLKSLQDTMAILWNASEIKGKNIEILNFD